MKEFTASLWRPFTALRCLLQCTEARQAPRYSYCCCMAVYCVASAKYIDSKEIQNSLVSVIITKVLHQNNKLLQVHV